MPEQTRDLTIGEALDLGCEMAIAGQHENAIGLFKGVLMHEPKNFEAIERLGSSLFELKRYHEALYWFWRGRKIDRKSPMALTNYGLCVCQLGHPEEGIADLERAVAIAERLPQMFNEAKALCYNNLGNTLERLGRHKEALPVLDKGIALNPNDGFPRYNRGIVLLRLNRTAEAIETFDRAIAINPNDADAHYNRGMGRLLLGDFTGGFEDYEYRLLTSENQVINLGLPADKKWTGAEPLEGRTILVHCEQGLGDDIQFLRFLPQLAALNPAKIVLITHNAIRPLLTALPENVTVLPSGAPLEGQYDCWVPLMSLPQRLGTTEASIPPPMFLDIEPGRIEAWRTGIAPSRVTLNVGVCWAGNWLHKNDAHRSIALSTFGKLFEAEGVNFVSLQQMRPDETELFAKLKEEHPNLRAMFFNNFRDTAAAMLSLDMVISVDTAVAHLSATLGVPTKILVPAFSTDWRWMRGREDSPWYPAAKLYRQPKAGDWASVIARLRNELAATAAQQRAA